MQIVHVLYECHIAWHKVKTYLVKEDKYGNKEGYVKQKIIISTVIIYKCDMHILHYKESKTKNGYSQTLTL